MRVPNKFCFWLSILLMVIPGLLGVVIFVYFSLIDRAALQAAYTHYAQVAGSTADLRAVFIAESQQNIHRINLFAEGVWALLAAILAGIGLHGIVQRDAAIAEFTAAGRAYGPDNSAKISRATSETSSASSPGVGE